MLLPKYGASSRPLSNSMAITKNPDHPAIKYRNTRYMGWSVARRTGPFDTVPGAPLVCVIAGDFPVAPYCKSIEAVIESVVER
jgi:hypothetical protein